MRGDATHPASPRCSSRGAAGRVLPVPDSVGGCSPASLRGPSSAALAAGRAVLSALTLGATVTSGARGGGVLSVRGRRLTRASLRRHRRGPALAGGVRRRRRRAGARRRRPRLPGGLAAGAQRDQASGEQDRQEHAGDRSECGQHEQSPGDGVRRGATEGDGLHHQDEPCGDRGEDPAGQQGRLAPACSPRVGARRGAAIGARCGRHAHSLPARRASAYSDRGCRPDSTAASQGVDTRVSRRLTCDFGTYRENVPGSLARPDREAYGDHYI